MHAHRPTGWNTWDYRGFNRLVYLRNGQTRISIQYAVWDESVRPTEPGSRKLGELHENFRWEHARRIGPHAPLGLPARMDFAVGEVLFRAEAVAEGEALHLRLEPQGPTNLRIVFQFLAPDGEALDVRNATRGQFAGWNIDVEGAGWPQEYFLNLPCPYAVGLPGQAAALTVWPRTSAPARPDVPTSFAAYAQTALAGSGALADAPQALSQAVNWNALYDSRRRLMFAPVCRDWCIDWRGPIVFGWDSFFATLLSAAESRELARGNFEAAMAGVDELGFVPNYYMAHGATSRDRSMPCLGSWAAWKLEGSNPDTEWLGRMYPRLRRWHGFWMKHRNGAKNGLLAWGSNAAPPYEFPQLLPYNPALQHTAKCAMYEAGLDNSPMYDEVPFNAESNTFELDDVGLSSFFALDCAALADIATRLGKAAHAAALRREHESIKQRINDLLWDEEQGLYVNRHWDGRLSRRWSPTSFFPLLAGVASPERAQRMVREHLLNEREFWGQYVIPSIARSDPGFGDNDYWRGRIWGPFNYLVGEGLRRYRLDDVAADLARRGLEMFLRNWHEDGGVYENYNSETGKGPDVWNAARLYHWGGLLALQAIHELIDSEPDGYLRFGSVAFPDSGIRNFRLAGLAYDVEMDAGLRVRCQGQTLLECTGRAVVRVPWAGSDAAVPLEVRAAGPARLTLWPGPTADAPVRPILPLDRRVRLQDGRVVSPRPLTTGMGVEYSW